MVENGVYGERMAQMCAQYRIAHETHDGAWMEAPDVGAIAARLDAARRGRFHAPCRRAPRDHHRAPELISLRSGRLCAAHGVQIAARRRQQLRRRSHRFRGPQPRGRGRDGEQVPARRAGCFVRDRAAQRACAAAVSRTYYLDLAGWRDCRISATRRSRRPCMSYYGLRRGAARVSASRAAAPRAISATRRWPNRCARAWRNWASSGAARAAESSVVLRAYRCPPASPIRCCTMPQGRWLRDLCGAGRSVEDAVPHPRWVNFAGGYRPAARMRCAVARVSLPAQHQCGSPPPIEVVVAGRCARFRAQRCRRRARIALNFLPCAVAAVLATAPCPASAQDDPVIPPPPAPNVTPDAPARAGWTSWLNPATAPFIPVPEIAVDPDSGTTLGMLATWVQTDDQHEIRRIFAPDVLHDLAIGQGIFQHSPDAHDGRNVRRPALRRQRGFCPLAPGWFSRSSGDFLANRFAEQASVYARAHRRLAASGQGPNREGISHGNRKNRCRHRRHG